MKRYPCKSRLIITYKQVKGDSHHIFIPLEDLSNSLRGKLPLANIASAIGRVIHGVGFKITIPATKLPTIVEEEEETKMSAEKMEKVSITDDDNDKKSDHRTFCPALYQDPIINMIEKHYCAILKTTMILESQYVSCSLRSS
jgi:hypothetical protein